MTGSRRARDHRLLDAVDALKRDRFSGSVWRVAREGRDPLQGAPSSSRWCNGAFDALYTSLDRDGALAEIHALISQQPVLPSKIRSLVHCIHVETKAVLRLPDLAALAKLGVDTARYRERDYSATQPLADAAYFLGFYGLIAPSARWNCLNLVLFTDRIAPDCIKLKATEKKPVDWAAWRKLRRGGRG